jgi:hypothetical protein
MCIKSLSGWGVGDLCQKTFFTAITVRLRRCCIGGSFAVIFCVALFYILIGIAMSGVLNFALRGRANIFSITGRLIGFVHS